MNTLPVESAAATPSDLSPPPLGRRDLAPCALIAGIIIAAFWPVVSLQRALFYFDITDLNLPFRHFYGHWISQGRFPLWTESIYCGYPIFAEGQAGALYPLNLLLFTCLPSWVAMNLSTVGHLLGLCLFGYLFFRGLASPAGAFTGALALGLNAFVVQRLIHTAPLHQMTWAPLLFWIVDRAFQTGRFRWLLCGAAVVAVQVLAGQQQFAMVTAFGLIPWILFRAWTTRDATRWRERAGRAAVAVAVLYGMGAALAAVQIIPSVELLRLSIRAEQASTADAVMGSWPPALAASLIFPDAFGSRMWGTHWLDSVIPYQEMGCFAGAVTALLAVVGAARSPGRRATFFTGLGLAAMLCAMGSYSFLWPMMSRSPVLGSFRTPARMAFLAVFAACALAARGVDSVAAGRRPQLRAPLGLFCFLAACALAVIHATYGDALFTEAPAVAGSSASLLFAEIKRDAATRLCLLAGAFLAMFFLPSATRSRTVMAWLLASLTAADALLYTTGRLPTAPPDCWTDTPPLAAALQRAQGHDRFWSGGVPAQTAGAYREAGWARGVAGMSEAVQALPDNTAVMYGLRSVSGRLAVRLSRHRQFWLSRAPWQAVACGPRFLFSTRKGDAAHGTLVASVATSRGDIHLLERNVYPPRAWLVHRAKAAESADAATAALALVRDPMREAVVECAPEKIERLREPASSELESALITRGEPDSVTLSVRAAAPALVVLADTWYPGWKALVDGSQAEIYPVNALFRGVLVEPGEHVIQMAYEPVSFRWGGAVSLAALAALIVLWLRPSRDWTFPEGQRPRHRWRTWRAGLACAFVVIVALSAALNPDLWRRSAFPKYADPPAPALTE